MLAKTATHLHFESEILLQVLDDHDQKRQLDAQCLLQLSRAGDERGADIRADNLQHQALDVVVGDALDVTVAHLFVPYLQRLAADTVQNRQEARLEGVLEHDADEAIGGHWSVLFIGLQSKRLLFDFDKKCA